MGVIYLDHLAATPLHPRVKEAMIHHIETVFGNPSTDNQVGQPAAEQYFAAPRPWGQAPP